MENPYELDKAEHDRVYAEIAKRRLAGTEAQEQPIAVITGGQPGSGKGGLTAKAVQEMSRQGGYVLVDPDELRPLHPHHFDLMNKNDREAADFTHTDASKWAKRLTNDAIEGRRNLIVDQTSKSPDSLVALTTKLTEAGYQVELRVIAVKAEISAQRIHTRYENEKEKEGVGRFVPKEVHDAACKGLPESVEAVERAKTIDRISVHDKNQKPIYENTLRDGQWVTQPAARAALEAERERPLTVEDLRNKTAAYTKLCEQLESRGAQQVERDTMEAMRLEATRQLVSETLRQPVPSEVLTTHPGSVDSQADVVMNPATGTVAAGVKSDHAPAVMNNQVGNAEVAVFHIDDMSTAAFEDLGRNVELAQVLNNAAERINNGEQAPFELNDTNGNSIGRYEIVPANATTAPAIGGASFTVDLSQPAFARDRDTQLAEYLSYASNHIYSGDAGTKASIPAADGAVVGALNISPVAPAPAVNAVKDRDVRYPAPSI